jgi:hypothetical protein
LDAAAISNAEKKIKILQLGQLQYQNTSYRAVLNGTYIYTKRTRVERRAIIFPQANYPLAYLEAISTKVVLCPVPKGSSEHAHSLSLGSARGSRGAPGAETVEARLPRYPYQF